jgi:uncharacterized protein (AIM24 family)
MSASRQWLLLCVSQNRYYSNHSRLRRLVTFQTKKSLLARLNVFLACVEQMELGAQLQLYQAVVLKEIIGELQTEISGEIIVQKFLIIVVTAERRGVAARTRVQPDTGALSTTGVQFDIERRAEIEVLHASGVVRHEETEVHVVETRNTDRNQETVRTGR